MAHGSIRGGVIHKSHTCTLYLSLPLPIYVNGRVVVSTQKIMHPVHVLGIIKYVDKSVSLGYYNVDKQRSRGAEEEGEEIAINYTNAMQQRCIITARGGVW